MVSQFAHWLPGKYWNCVKLSSWQCRHCHLLLKTDWKLGGWSAVLRYAAMRATFIYKSSLNHATKRVIGMFTESQDSPSLSSLPGGLCLSRAKYSASVHGCHSRVQQKRLEKDRTWTCEHWNDVQTAARYTLSVFIQSSTNQHQDCLHLNSVSGECTSKHISGPLLVS